MDDLHLANRLDIEKGGLKISLVHHIFLSFSNPCICFRGRTIKVSLLQFELRAKGNILTTKRFLVYSTSSS